MSARRRRAAWLGVSLVLLVSSERRLADADLNRLSRAVVIENDDRLDGDEIAVRLDLGQAGVAHIVVAGAAVADRDVVERTHVERPRHPALESHGPRAPPPPSPAVAA